jgi:hypothetical protein
MMLPWKLESILMCLTSHSCASALETACLNAGDNIGLMNAEDKCNRGHA